MAVISRLVQRGFSVFLLTAVALSIGCAGGGGQAKSDDESLDQADATERDVELGGAVAIRFAVEVAGDVSGPIYVLLSGADNQVGWIQAFRGGERIHFRERCEIEDCANRGVVCGAAMPTIQNIGDGAQTRMIEFVWDGMTSVFDSASGCEIRRPALPGDYIARFCYSREAEFDGDSDPTLAVPGRLIRPTFTDKPFTLLEQEVVLRI
jgi:hypothetical protein